MIFKRAVILAALIMIIAGSVYAENCEMARYDSEQTGYTAEKITLPVALSWEHTGNKYDNNPASPVATEDTVFFACGERIYAVEAETGALKWRYPSDQGLGGSVKGTPLYYDGSLYFGAGDGNLYCLNAETGQFKWAYQTRNAIRCPPVVSNGIIFFGSDDNSIYAIDAEEGQSAWSKQFTARDDFANGIAVGSGMVVAACMDGNIYGIHQASGKLRWIFRMPSAPILTSPIVVNNIAVMAVGNIMYGLTARSGQQRWHITLQSEAAATPAALDNDIYVPCRDKKLYAYTMSGRQMAYKWLEPADLGGKPLSSPVIAGDTIYVTTTKGTIVALNAEDGSRKWRYAIAPSQITTPGQDFTDAASSPTISNGNLMVLTDDGVLHCFKSNAPDNTPPDVINPLPLAGTAMSGAPPITIQAILYDIGSGVDFSSVTLSLDNQPKDYTAIPEKALITYQTDIGGEGKPRVTLPDGVHTIKLTAKDYKGNLVTKEWHFIADSSLPPPKISAPAPVGKKEKEPPSRPRWQRGGGPTPPSPGGDGGAPPHPDAPPPPPPPMPGPSVPHGPYPDEGPNQGGNPNPNGPPAPGPGPMPEPGMPPGPSPTPDPGMPPPNAPDGPPPPGPFGA